MEEGPCFTNHPGVAEFKYNPDGSITTIGKCKGVNKI